MNVSNYIPYSKNCFSSLQGERGPVGSKGERVCKIRLVAMIFFMFISRFQSEFCMLMTMYMYLGHIPFSIKNLKREICHLDMTFIGQILRSPCLLFTTHLRKCICKGIFSSLCHCYSTRLPFLFRVIRERKDNWDPWDCP